MPIKSCLPPDPTSIIIINPKPITNLASITIIYLKPITQPYIDHNYQPQTNHPPPHPSQLSTPNQSLHLYSPLKKRILISLSCLIVLANAIRQISDIRISISIGLGAIGQTRMLRPRLCIGALRRGGGRGALLLYRHDKSTAGGEVHLELAVLGDGNLAAFVVFCRTVGIDAVVERVGLATGDVER